MPLKPPRYVDTVRRPIIHEMQGTLDLKDPNMDGVLDIYDLGVVITHLIARMSGKAQAGTPPPSRRGTP